MRSWSLVKMGTSVNQKKLFFNLRKAKSKISVLEEGDLQPDQVKLVQQSFAQVAPIADMIARPRHPYTRALIAALPSLETRGALAGIPGLAPSLRDLPPGCAFHPRCALAIDRCRAERPLLHAIDDAQVACHLA